ETDASLGASLSTSFVLLIVDFSDTVGAFAETSAGSFSVFTVSVAALLRRVVFLTASALGLSLVSILALAAVEATFLLVVFLALAAGFSTFSLAVVFLVTVFAVVFVAVFAAVF